MSPDGGVGAAPVGKLHSVQALRGVAVLLVVWAHISAPYGFEAHYIGGPRLTGWMHFPSVIGVDLFFVVSGVIITITSWHWIGQPRAGRRFVYRRATRIYPVYAIVTTLILIVFLVRPDLVDSHAVHRPEILPSLLILPQPGDPLVAVGWTLVYELYFYAVFAVAACLGRRSLPWILVGWAMVTICLHVLVAPTNQPYLRVASDLINLEFVFGAFVGLCVVRRVLVKPRLVLAGSTAVLVALLGYLIVTDPPNFPSAWFQVAAVGGSIALAVYAVVGFELARAPGVPRLLVRIGDGSYSIYLWHVPLLAVIGLLIERIRPTPFVPHVVALGLAFAVVVVAGLWLYDRLERPLLRAFHTRRFNRGSGEKTWNPPGEVDITSMARSAVVYEARGSD